MPFTPQMQLPLVISPSPFLSEMIAGFECGLVHGGHHDLLVPTRHTPQDQMRRHFEIAIEHGMRTVRDGLVPGHDVTDRLRVARAVGVQGVWDLSHYHRNDSPAYWARTVADSAVGICGAERLWLCPVNEPSLYPTIAGMARDDAVNMAVL